VIGLEEPNPVAARAEKVARSGRNQRRLTWSGWIRWRPGPGRQLDPAVTDGSDEEGNGPVEPSGDERRGGSAGEELVTVGLKEGRPTRGRLEEAAAGGGATEVDSS
jgi:hypothetical protein